MCVPWELNPKPFALLTQCSTTVTYIVTFTYVHASHSYACMSDRFSIHYFLFKQELTLKPGNTYRNTFHASGTPPAWPMSEAPIESRQFIGWWRDAISDALTSSAYTGERAIHSSDFSVFTKRSHCPSLLRFSGPNLLSAIIHLHFSDCLSGTLFSSRWSAMEYRRCQPPCACFIAREDPHSKCIKCLGFSHARDAVYGTSKCKICEDFRLITLYSRLEACEKESSIFPRRAPGTSAASREATTWGSDVELEEMESEQTGLAFSLPLSPERVRANSPVEFAHDFLFPSTWIFYFRGHVILFPSG